MHRVVFIFGNGRSRRTSCVINKHLCLVHVKPFHFDEAFNLIISVHVNVAIIVRKAKNSHTGVQRAVLLILFILFSIK